MEKNEKGAPTGSVESIQSLKITTAYRMLSSVGSVASTIILALVAIVYNEVRDEWRELKNNVSAIQKELDTAPTSVEFDQVRSKLQNLNDRVIVIENRCCGLEDYSEKPAKDKGFGP